MSCTGIIHTMLTDQQRPHVLGIMCMGLYDFNQYVLTKEHKITLNVTITYFYGTRYPPHRQMMTGRRNESITAWICSFESRYNNNHIITLLLEYFFHLVISHHLKTQVYCTLKIIATLRIILGYFVRTCWFD